MKNNYYVGNSYIITNALISLNKLEGRNILDEKDLKNYKNIIESKCINNNIYIRTFSDENQNLQDEIMILNTKSGKLYCKLPGINIESLENKYRRNLPFGLTNIFNSIDSDDRLKRETTDLLILKRKQKTFESSCIVTPKIEKKEKSIIKEYYVSQK